MGWEGPDGREVTAAKCEPKERAAEVWLVGPLLNPQDLGPNLAHRRAQLMFENG